MVTAEVISWNMAWRHKCTIAWFKNLEAKSRDRLVCFPGCPAAKEVYEALDSVWSKHWGLKEWGPMYWHGAQEDTRHTVNKIIADRAMGIVVVRGIGSSPCLLVDLKPTLDSIILNEMQFGP